MNRLPQLADRIEKETGLSFPEGRQRDLTLGIGRISNAMEFEDNTACIDWLLAGPWDKSKSDLCAFHLTIGETYFFREARAFDLVCDYAREKLRNPALAGQGLRIWSTGCCTGEEPYSIAMSLKNALPGLDPRQLSILGTDINSRSLDHARAGIYRHWSFRKTGAALQKLYFSKQADGLFRLNDEIRQMVKFAELNLASSIYPSTATDTHAMDIIFCRNVLMYFSKPGAQQVIERFHQSLAPGGWLVVSPSEASAELFSGFSGVYYPDAIYFRKNGPRHDPPLFRPPAPAADAAKCGSGFDHGLPQYVFARDTKPATAGAYSLSPISSGRRRAPALPRDAEQPQQPRPGQGDATIDATGADAVVRARALANKGRVLHAMQCLDQAIQHSPACVDLYRAKAMIAMETGEHDEAMQNLKRVLYLQPDSIIARYLTGVAELARNRRPEAMKQFETASRLLAPLKDDEIVPGSEGLSAASLMGSVRAFIQKVHA